MRDEAEKANAILRTIKTRMIREKIVLLTIMLVRGAKHARHARASPRRGDVALQLRWAFASRSCSRLPGCGAGGGWSNATTVCAAPPPPPQVLVGLDGFLAWFFFLSPQCAMPS